MTIRHAEECFGGVEARTERQQGLTSSRVLGLAGVCCVLLPFAVALALLGKEQTRSFGQGSDSSRQQILSSARRSLPGPVNRGLRPRTRTSNVDVDVSSTNLTIVLENLQIGPQHGDDVPWMFTIGDNPFRRSRDPNLAYFANNRISWNADGSGDTSCQSRGSGARSRGTIEYDKNFLGLAKPPGRTTSSVELSEFTLKDFRHMNTEDADGPWEVLGRAGDTRMYEGARLDIRDSGELLLAVTDLQWFQNVSYPTPAGSAPRNVFEVSAYFVGRVDALASDSAWVAKLDPHQVGFIVGIVTSASFGSSKTCYTANTYWITLRGFPDVFGDGDRALRQSPRSYTRAAAVMAALSVVASAAVVAVAVAGALCAAGLIAAGGVGVPSPGSSSVVRILRVGAFSAKVWLLPGTHSQAAKEFGSGLSVFLLRFSNPFTAISPSPGPEAARVVSRQASESLTEAANTYEDFTDDLFEGAAFYCAIPVAVFVVLHVLIWLLTRKKSFERQVQAHAWMIYLFSIAISFIYTAAVMNSVGYYREHGGRRTGTPILYTVATFQLLVIGLGFLIFFCVVTVMAMLRVRSKMVRWVPKQELSDPEQRRSAIIAGEYEADERVWFHALFACYYSSMSGPRIWLAGIELIIVFLDAVLSATIEDDRTCLAILFAMYTLLFLMFVLFVPFADMIEGGLVIAIALLELTLLGLEFFGTVNPIFLSEDSEFAGVVLLFITIVLAIVIALYSDVVPTVTELLGYIRQRLAGGKSTASRDPSDDEESNSGSSHTSKWSALESEASQVETRDTLPDPEGSALMPAADPLVQYNAEREREVEETMERLFGTGAPSAPNGTSGHRELGSPAIVEGIVTNAVADPLVEYNAAREREVAKTMERLFGDSDSKGDNNDERDRDATAGDDVPAAEVADDRETMPVGGAGTRRESGEDAGPSVVVLEDAGAAPDAGGDSSEDAALGGSPVDSLTSGAGPERSSDDEEYDEAMRLLNSQGGGRTAKTGMLAGSRPPSRP